MLGLYEKCPVAYEKRYVQGLRIPPGSAAIIGTGAHVSAAADLTSKRDTGALLPDDQIADLARDSTNGAWDKEGVYLSPQERFLGETKAKGEAVDEAIGLATLHHRKLAPSLAPLHIERPFTIELNGFPVDLSGTIDLQTADGGLRDLKTRRAAPPADFADYCMDLTCYGLAAKALDGQEPTAMYMDFLVKSKTPRLVTLEGHRTEGAYRAFLLRLEAVSHAIESGSFPPCSPEHWMCSPTWCGYFDKCPYGRAARVTI